MDIECEDNKQQNKNKSNFMSKFEQEKYVLEAIKCNNTLSVCKKYGIPETNLRRWKKDYQQNVNAPIDDKKPKKQAFRPRYFKMECLLVDWIYEQRRIKLPVSMKQIQTKAKELIDPKYKNSFCASLGWFYRFTKRWKISRRTATHIQQKMQDDYMNLMNNWRSEIRQFRIEKGINQKQQIIFINFDETAVFFDLQSKKTYDYKGKREVTVKSVSEGKQRISVGLTIMSNGYKLPILSIFKSKSKREYPSIDETKMITYSNTSGWVNEYILQDYCSKLIFNLKRYPNTIFYFIWDKCPSHSKQSLIERFQKEKIELKFIPAGCTGLIQPLDVCIIKPFKDYLRQRFEEWFENYGCKQENQSKKGYIQPPTQEELQQWIISSFEKIDHCLVQKSFKVCGISEALDGTEDHIVNQKLRSKQDIGEYLNEVLNDQNNYNDYNDEREVIQSQLDSIDQHFTYENNQEIAQKVKGVISKIKLTQDDNEVETIINQEFQENLELLEEKEEYSITFSDIEDNDEILEEQPHKNIKTNDQQPIKPIVDIPYQSTMMMEEEENENKVDSQCKNKIKTFKDNIFNKQIHLIKFGNKVVQYKITQFMQ